MKVDFLVKPSVTACLLALPAAGIAVDTRIAAELMHFDYEETDLLGNTLNRETGYIPGLTVAASQPYRSIHNSVALSVYDGQVDYDGRTQSGQPHQTTTEQNIIRLQYRLDWSPAGTDGAFYGKAYWQQWDRDIQPNNGVLGLFERYRWWSIEAGAVVPFIQQNRHSLLLELGVLATTNGTITIDLTGAGFGNQSLDLGNSFGFSGGLNYQIMLSHNNGLRFGVQLNSWEFGRSNSKTISDGSRVITITEPDSATRQTILSAGYVHRF